MKSSNLQKNAWVTGLLLSVILQGCIESEFNFQANGDRDRDPAEITPHSEDTCTEDSSELPDDNLMWLSRTQIYNTYSELFGPSTAQKLKNEIETITLDLKSYNFDHALFKLAKEDIGKILVMSINAAKIIYNDSTSRKAVFNCSTYSPVPANCVDNYLNGFASKIFRRALSPTEKQNIKNRFFKNSSNINSGQLVDVLAYQLFHPLFLARFELGSSEKRQAQYSLNSYELATRLAFAITDTAPDQSLLSKAADQSLLEASVLQSEAERLLESSAAKKKFHDFAFYWMKSDASFTFAQLPDELVGNTQTVGLGEAAVDETQKFMEYVIWSQEGSYKDLLSSKVSFADHEGLASIYGHDPATNGEPRTFGDSQRMGVFGRLPFLYSPTSRTPLIRRSLNFREQVLCETVPQPSAAVFEERGDFVGTDEIMSQLSTREFIAALTGTDPNNSRTSCTTCHATINPMGNLFEEFDSLARVRTTELVFKSNGDFSEEVPTNSADEVRIGSEKILANGYADIITAVTNMKQSQRCFAKKLSSFTLARNFNSVKSCWVKEVYKTINQEGGSIKQAIVATIMHPKFRLRQLRD